MADTIAVLPSKVPPPQKLNTPDVRNFVLKEENIKRFMRTFEERDLLEIYKNTENFSISAVPDVCDYLLK